jgi:iron-sulfur cluster assembly protein
MADMIADVIPDVKNVEVIEAVSVTPLAADKIKTIMAEKSLTEHGLRVFVAGGGCSGYQYGMAFENNFLETDTVIEMSGVKVVIDHISLGYIQGATIDYVDNLMGGGFRIENPNAVAACGCGSSFRTKEGGEAEAHDHAHAEGGCSCSH